jgi:hypothetical protein
MDARELREALRTRCVHLKTKASYLGSPSPGDPENLFDTAVWWCEATCAKLGPDGGTASPERCGRPGPSCYRPPVRP